MTTNASGSKSYYSKFPLNPGDQIDNYLLGDYRQYDGSLSDVRSPSIPYNSLSVPCYGSCINSVTHIIRASTTLSNGQHALFAIPISAHNEFDSSYIISPVITTPNNNNYYKLLMLNVPNIGSDPFALPLNDIYASYRTAGTNDNSGIWTNINKIGDLSNITGDRIQFKFEFQMLGNCFGIPGRLCGFILTYNDLSTDSHYTPSVKWSDITNKRFAWRFSTAFGSSVPNLRIRLYDSVTNGLLLDDNTQSPTGTFEASTNDGVGWSAWTNSDMSNTTTYIRYTPSSLGNDIKVRALLTLL